MSHYVLDMTYTLSGSTIVRRSAVVRASNYGNDVSLPTATNATKFAGIAMTSQAIGGRALTVRKLGVAEAIAAGAIAAGAPLNIADGNGRVKALNEAAGTKVECIGFAESSATTTGDIIKIYICPHQRTM